MSIKANVLTGLASGIRGYQTGIRSREEAQRLKAEQDRKLASQPDPALVKSEKELALEQQIVTFNTELDRAAGKEFNEALRRSTLNKNPSAMNNAMKNPRIKQMFPNVARFLPVNLDDPEDLRMLDEEMRDQAAEDEQALPTPQDTSNPVDTLVPSLSGITGRPNTLGKEFWQNNPQLLSRYVKTVGKDGTVDYMDTNVFKARSGYKNFITDKEMEEELASLDLVKARREALGMDKKPKNSLAYQKGVELTQAQENVNNGIEVEKNKNIIRAIEKDFSYDPTDDQKEIAGIRKARDKFYLEQEGGRKGFLSRPMVPGSDEENTARELAFDLMKLDKNLKFTPEEEREVREIKTLTDLGDVVTGGLTSNATGLWDNFKAKIGGYIPGGHSAPEEKAARTAFATFYNTVLNRTFGATVPKAEMEKMTSAMANLNQQLPSVLAGLRGQVAKLRSSINSIGNFTDPLIAKVFLGMNKQQINELISRIDIAITTMTGQDPNKGSGVAAKGNAGGGYVPRKSEPSKADREAAKALLGDM